MIRMGSAFEYDSLAGGYFPKVLNDEGEIVWGQEDISVPGLGIDHFITIQEAGYASYGDNLNKYYINGQWTCPDYTTEYFAQALAGGLSTDALTVTLDGLGLTDEYILSGQTSIALSEAEEGKSWNQSHIIRLILKQ